MQQYVQKSMRTKLPRRSSSVYLRSVLSHTRSSGNSGAIMWIALDYVQITLVVAGEMNAVR